MASTQRDIQRFGFPDRSGLEVVAGLVNDGSAEAVARAAVAEAVSHGARLRFIQVVPKELSGEDLAEADAATFKAALRALRGHPRTASVFELVTGEAHRVLVERSRGAAVLVVGEDQGVGEQLVAGYCRLHARCSVKVVSRSA